MNISKFLGIILIVLSILFLGLQVFDRELDAYGVKAIAMSLLVVLYFVTVKKKHLLFSLFLVTYAIAEVYNYFSYGIHAPDHLNYEIHYLVCNAIYTIAYLFLIFRILSLMNLKKALLKFPFQSLLLFALGIFVVYMIQDLSEPEVMLDYELEVEIIYNAVIMVLVCLALINYMYNESKKSMNILIGCMCIIFSEVFQIAYYYIISYNVAVSVAYSFFLVLAFVFFYYQSKLVNENKTV